MHKKVLIFDLGGVVIDLHVDRSFKALAAMGVAPELLSESGSVVNDMMTKYDRGDITTDELLDQMSAFIPVDRCEESGVALRERMLEVWNMMLGDFSADKLRQLELLRSKCYRVVMLSNTNEAHWPEIERKFMLAAGNPMNVCFDALYLSYRMRCRKPEPVIFAALLENEGVAAADCIFFDDSMVNCEAARAMGIEAVLVERNAPWNNALMDSLI